MVGVKKYRVLANNLAAFIVYLGEKGYTRTSTFMPGTREHAEAGLRYDIVLVHAWRAGKPKPEGGA